VAGSILGHIAGNHRLIFTETTVSTLSPVLAGMVAGSIQNEKTDEKYYQTKQFLYFVATFH
jgi:hypothetical protein